MRFSRYAIYAVPQGVFYARGAAWLGWDSESGTRRDQPALPGLSQAVTERPARYGFHATLRAPFALKDGVSYEDLEAVCGDLAHHLNALNLGQLQLARLGRFLAFIPEPRQDIVDFAAEILRRSNGLRRPLSEEEIEKRCSKRFEMSDRANLERWGYAHVLDRFKLHFTLTEKLEKMRLPELERAAHVWFEKTAQGVHWIDDLCLMGEDAESGNFHLLRRFPLARGGQA